jgi:hypothetical protein
MCTFAGGLSVPSSMQEVLKRMRMDSHVPLTSSTVRSFIYEVLRISPPVQMVPFNQGTGRVHNSVACALRDGATAQGKI